MEANRAPLEHALELSEMMLAAARQGDWAGAAELDGERQPLLRAPHPPGEHSVRQLRQLLEHNEALAGLVGQAREAAAHALGDHARTLRALKTYVSYIR